jgi:hypothetical protein
MAMSALLVTIIIAVTLFVALVVRMGIRSPSGRHLSAESKDAVKVSMGMVATMTAAARPARESAKGSPDTTRSELVQMAAIAASIACSRCTGPTRQARGKLRTALGEAIAGMAGGRCPVRLEPDERASNAIYVTIHRLTPHDDVQRDLKALATTLANDLGELRTASRAVHSLGVDADADHRRLLAGGDLRKLQPRRAAQRHDDGRVDRRRAVVVGAVFLVLGLDTPLSGIIRISSAPMQKVLVNSSRERTSP